MLDECAALTADMRLSKAALLLEDGPIWKAFTAAEILLVWLQSW